MGETFNVFGREHGSAWTWRKHGDAALEAHIAARDPPEPSFDELIDALSRLASEVREAFKQRSVHADRGLRHVVIFARRALTNVRCDDVARLCAASQHVAARVGPNLGPRFFARCKSFGNQDFRRPPQLALGAGVQQYQRPANLLQ